MIFLALDQSSNVTGFSVWKDDNLIEYGKVKFEGEFFHRLSQLKSWMLERIDELAAEDDIEVIIEEIQEQSNMLTYKMLAAVQGVLLTKLFERNIKTHLVYSASWKSTCGIKGKNRTEQKQNTQKYILDKYGYKATQDESDAICIGEHIATKQKNWGRQ
jgi:Holliday junction resolvasome RuvABC endonuclease subunit